MIREFSLMARKKRRRPKVRDQSHIIADLSVNFLERKVLQRGHQLVRMPAPEYGIDAWMYHFSPEGYPENGHVFFQLKATNSIRIVENGRFVTAKVESPHLRDWWYRKHHPVVLVLYDAANDRAYWIDVEAYCDELNKTEPRRLTLDQQTVTVRVPVKNKLTLRAVDHFRRLSLSRMEPNDCHQQDVAGLGR